VIVSAVGFASRRTDVEFFSDRDGIRRPAFSFQSLCALRAMSIQALAKMLTQLQQR
jgi:hypothetical protein